MAKSFLFFAALFIGLSSTAKDNLDSLWSVWNNEDEVDTNRLEAINEILLMRNGWELFDSAMHYAQLMKELAQQTEHKKWIAQAFICMGRSFHHKRDYKNVRAYCSKALAIYEEIKDEKGQGAMYHSLGNLCLEQSQYEKALEHFNKSLTFSGKANDLSGQANTMNDIGLIHFKRGNYLKTLHYFEQCLKIKEELGDVRAIMIVNSNIASVYTTLENFERALTHLDKCSSYLNDAKDKRAISGLYKGYAELYEQQGKIDLALENYLYAMPLTKEAQDNWGLAILYSSIGNMYQMKEEMDKAFEFYEKSIQVSKEIGNKEVLAISYTNISSIHYYKGNIQDAIDWGEKGLDLAQEANTVLSIRNASDVLYNAYKASGQLDQALKMHELFLQMNDSINSKENKETAIKIEYEHQYEKEKALAAAMHQEELNISAEREKRQQLKLYAAAGGLALVLLIAFLIFNRLRTTRKQKKVIEDQKSLVEEKNQQIVDSIQYAKGLQEATLPTEKILNNCLPKSFIFYRPKDIVAGDFYWVETIHEWTYFAAADCTGHGVPGAMVSVVCSNALTKALLEEEIYEPAAILNRTRDLVIQRFKRSEKRIMDGMDISLCALHQNTGKIKWAGANNPLWIIRKDSQEIEVLKADDQPVGMYPIREPFNQLELQLNEGDTMYLFSDGFSDQFGGKNGKKYKSSNFRRFLLSIKDKDMDLQHQLIKEEFDRWKGNFEQIDDVCVMGVRV